MQSQWFVIHTLAGQELKVKDSIEKRLKPEEMTEFVREVLVPMEKVAEVRGGKKTVTTRKLHPGYVYVDITLLDDNKRLLDRPWYFIRETPGIIGFVGGDRPIPVSEDEIKVIKDQVSDAEDVERPKVHFDVGETIKINDGPFLNFSGVIEEVDPDKGKLKVTVNIFGPFLNFSGVIEEIDFERGKLKVTVNIFGRNTPVELEYWQVEKA
jgi:transcriptional antiterminator NusG